MSEHSSWGSAELGGELLTYPGYRGHFQAAARFSGSGTDFHCEVGVFDTSFQDESESTEGALHDAGRVILRWQEIAPGPEPDSWVSIPRRRSLTLAAMPFRTVTGNRVILLKITRAAAGGGDYNFSDPSLGQVGVNFTWQLAERIPAAAASSDVLVIAAVRIDPASGNVEVMQLHHGAATLWIPLEGSENSSSSSEGSGDPSSSSWDDPPRPPNPPWPPDDSSSSSDSSSTSSSDSVSNWIEVTAVIRIDFSDPQSTTVTTLTGMFDPFSPNGDGSFSVMLTGNMILYENNEQISTSPASMTWQIFPNAEEDRWEVRSDGSLLSGLRWGYVEPDPEGADESIETPIYQFPSLSRYPYCPQGVIHVQRETISGASLAHPIWVQINDTQINFSAL